MEERVQIVNELGLHARPISKWLNVVRKHEIELSVVKEGKSYNGTSMIALMSMAAKKGDALILKASGKQAQAAVSELKALIADGFGE